MSRLVMSMPGSLAVVSESGVEPTTFTFPTDKCLSLRTPKSDDRFPEERALEMLRWRRREMWPVLSLHQVSDRCPVVRFQVLLCTKYRLNIKPSNSHSWIFLPVAIITEEDSDCLWTGKIRWIKRS